MEFKEGQIYEGSISLSGENNGPSKRWIVIKPFEKIHIHSIDDPLDLHCWPLFSAMKGLEQGYIKLIETDTLHPVVQLQRAKEKLGIKDNHMGLQKGALDKMLKLLESAVATGQSYAPYAVGEILTFINCTNHDNKKTPHIKEQLNKHLQTLNYQPIS